MPYIKKEERDKLDPLFNYLLQVIDEEPNLLTGDSIGNLNYILTKIILTSNPKRYKDFNAILGVLEAIKLELYRRMVASYEDVKIKENGDVYPK